MTEQEIFEKLKEALDYKYMYDSWEWGEEQKEVDNLEDYLRIIKKEREIDKCFEGAELDRLTTFNRNITCGTWGRGRRVVCVSGHCETSMHKSSTTLMF